MLKKRKMSIRTRIFILLGITLILFSCAHKQPQPYKHFEEALTNINTPTLINDYQQKYFEWKSNVQGGGCVGANGIVDIGVNLAECPPSFIFNNDGRGNCGAFTTFALHLLRKAGYEAYPLYTYSKWPDMLAPGHQPRDYHIVTLYKDNGKWYTMNNGLPVPEGIKGPFNSIEDLPYKVLRVDKKY